MIIRKTHILWDVRNMCEIPGYDTADGRAQTVPWAYGIVKKGRKTNEMTPAEKMQDRSQVISDAIRGNKPKRVPHVCDFWTWKVWASGNKLSDVVYNTPKYVDVMRYMLDNYEFDAYTDTGGRNPLAVPRALGLDETIYIINDELNSIAVPEQCPMEADEYDELIKLGYYKFSWTKIAERRGGRLKDRPNLPAILDAADAYNEFLAMNRDVASLMKEYGMPQKQAFSMSFTGIEYVFNYLRGFKNTSIDLRRRYDKLCEACDVITEEMKNDYYQSPAAQCDGPTPGYAFDMFFSLLSHTILNAKQFERLIWPKFKELSEIAVKHNKTCYVHNEGNSEHLYDFWKDLPANRFTFAVEQNDIFRMKKELPNIVPQGGMLTTVLSTATPEEVVDYAKMLIDKLGYDGQYILATDKMVSFKTDCTQENLHALCDFLTDFRYG